MQKYRQKYRVAKAAVLYIAVPKPKTTSAKSDYKSISLTKGLIIQSVSKEDGGVNFLLGEGTFWLYSDEIEEYLSIHTEPSSVWEKLNA